jgi:hypothetical protein
MPTQLLPIGFPVTLIQNQVYALPARLTYVTSTAAVDISVNSSTWSALTGANTLGVYTSASFVRCTTAGSSIVCKS